MRFDFVTIFPELITSYFSQGIISQGAKKGLVEIHAHDLRDHGQGNYRQVDDRAFGGGAGMVLMFQPLAAAISAIESDYKQDGISNYAVVATTAKGETYTQEQAKRFAGQTQQGQTGTINIEAMILLCGRYEGFDQRVLDELVDYQLSLGNYVLSGGEIAAIAIADSVARLIPGVLGKEESFETDSFYVDGSTTQHPQYTRPEVINHNGKQLKVPPTLLSGDHAAIADWREQNSNRSTTSENSESL